MVKRFTNKDVLKMVEENDVKFIRLQFTDVFGILKNVAITSKQLERVLEEGCMFDGSSIDGFVRIEESDMQLMPDTAAWLNKDRISKEAIFDPVLNIKLGILYLNFLDERFDFNVAVLSAYNGGPGNVKKWLSNREGENIQQYIEEIPFDETRNYVKKVLTSYAMYKMLYETDCK